MKQEMSLKEIQNTELQILIQFHDICLKNGWRYSLCGGTLIGAVRHKGFIPWDDDIDVIMPRPDYDEFISYCKSNTLPFKIASYDTIEGYYSLYIKIWDPSTIIIDPVLKGDYEIGIHMDVFPVDGLGNTKKEALNIFNKTAWDREVLNACAWKSYFKSKSHSLIYEPIRLAMFIISRAADPKRLIAKLEKEYRRHSFENSNYVGCVSGSYRKKEIIEKRLLDGFTELVFEGVKLKAVKHYHEYLTHYYGDYMKLPPEEKRETHHTFKAYRTI